jgi:hypothetical protein
MLRVSNQRFTTATNGHSTMERMLEYRSQAIGHTNRKRFSRMGSNCTKLRQKSSHFGCWDNPGYICRPRSRLQFAFDWVIVYFNGLIDDGEIHQARDMTWLGGGCATTVFLNYLYKPRCVKNRRNKKTNTIYESGQHECAVPT